MKIKPFAWIFLLLFTLVLSSPLLLNGLQSDGRYLVNGGHDALWHLSLIKEITRQFPPQFPGAAGLPLQNYHYFSHILMAIIPRLTGLSIPFLYFQIYNPLLVFGLALVVFRLALAIVKDQLRALLIAFITLFSGSAAFLLPYLSQTENWRGHSFMLEQPHNEFFNLNATFAYILVFSCFYFVYQFQISQRFKQIIYASFSAIVLVGIKSFYAIPLLGGLFLLTLFSRRLKNYQKLFIGSAQIFLPLLIIKLITASGTGISGNLNFSPGWLLQKMFESSNRVYQPDLLLRQQVYLVANNLPRLIQITVYQLLFYFLGNFWLRLLGLFILVKKKIFNWETKLFIITAVGLSALFPLVFTTNPDYFNTVQFGQVSVILMSFLAGLFFTLVPRRLIVSLALTLILSITFFHDYFFTHKFTDFYVDNNQVTAIDFIKRHTDNRAIFLINNHNQYEMIIPGLALRRTYFNGLKQIQVLGYPYLERQQLNTDFFSAKLSPAEAAEFLKANHIDYIYMLKDPLLLKLYSLETKVIFANQDYQIIKL